MDTRSKIADAAAVPRGVRAVTGYFDPVHAAHARRLSELRQAGTPLAVVITNPREPLLPERARAELVAGLAVVDYVVLCDDNPVEDVLARLAPVEVVAEEEADIERTRDLFAHVHARQKAGG